MVFIRQLQDADLHQLHEIDVSEHITLVYRLVDGRLKPEEHDWHRPAWDEASWQQQMTVWRDTLKPDVLLGAFVGDQVVGLASLRYRLSPNMAQLTTLHVGQAFRRQGVASDLLQAVIALAQESGAEAIYVSASPSESAVGFYLSHGFRPTTAPDPEMYKLEPEDIHMIRPVSPGSSE